MNLIIYIFVIICAACSSQCQDNLSQEVYIYRLQNESNDRIYLGKISNFDKQNIKEYKIHDSEQSTKRFFELSPSGNLSFLPNASSQSRYEFEVQMTISNWTISSPRHFITKMGVNIRIMSSKTIHKSGSFRIQGITVEEFIKSDSKNSLTNLRDKLSTYLNEKINKQEFCSREIKGNLGIQIFSIVSKINDPKMLDLRFTATTTKKETYNFVDQIHFVILENKKEIKEKFNFDIVEVNINECRSEESKCESSCYNNITEILPSNAIMTKHHLFYGLNIIVKPVCECRHNFDSFNDVMKNINEIDIQNHCPLFFPNIEPCENLSINLNFIPKSNSGIIFQFDSIPYNMSHNIQDVLMLQLVETTPHLIVDFGSGRTEITSTCNVTLSQPSTISIIINQQHIELIIKKNNSPSCRTIRQMNGVSKVLNIDAPIFISSETLSSLNHLGSKNSQQTEPKINLLDGVITSLQINFFETDSSISLNSREYKLITLMKIVIGILSVILIVLLLIFIKHKISVSISIVCKLFM